MPLIRVFEAPTIRGLALFLAPGGIQMQPRVDQLSRVDQSSGPLQWDP